MSRTSVVSFRIDNQVRKILQAKAKESGKDLGNFCLDAIKTAELGWRVDGISQRITAVEKAIAALPNNRQMDAMLKILVKEIRAVRTRK